MGFTITKEQQQQFGELYVDAANPALQRKGAELYLEHIGFIGEQYFNDGLVAEIPHVVMHDGKELADGALCALETSMNGHANIHLAGQAEEAALSQALERTLEEHVASLARPDENWRKFVSEEAIKLPERRDQDKPVLDGFKFRRRYIRKPAEFTQSEKKHDDHNGFPYQRKDRRAPAFNPQEERRYGRCKNTWGHINDAKQMSPEKRDFWIGWMLENAEQYTPQHFLRVLRVSNGLSTNEMGRILHLSQRKYSVYENGKLLPLRHIFTILDQNIFHLPTAVFFSRSEEKECKAISMEAAGIFLNKLTPMQSRPLMFFGTLMKEQLFSVLRAELAAHSAGELTVGELPDFASVLRFLMQGKKIKDIMPYLAIAHADSKQIRVKLKEELAGNTASTFLMAHLPELKPVLALSDEQIDCLRQLPMAKPARGKRYSRFNPAYTDKESPLNSLIEKARMALASGRPYKHADEQDINANKFLRLWRQATGEAMQEIAQRYGVISRDSIRQLEVVSQYIRPENLEDIIIDNVWRLPEGENGAVRDDIAELLRGLNERAKKERPRSGPRPRHIEGNGRG